MACTTKIDYTPQVSEKPLGLPQITQGWQAALNIAKATGRPLPAVAANAPDAPTKAPEDNANARIGLTKGAVIETLDGPKPVENLKPGDLLRTGSGAYRPLRHVFRVELDAPRRAIRINAEALGPGLPEKGIRLPRDQQIHVTSDIARRMFGHEGALVPAHLLTALPGIAAARVKDRVHYLLLMDRQDTVLTRGVPTETLAPCARNLDLVPAHLRRAITRLYPGFGQDKPKAARHLNVPKTKRQKRLVHKHANSGTPLLGDDPAPEDHKTG
ncbi:hypothetical protein FDP25_02250 [Roseovarius sp. A21]|uniref:Hedgehog/Intein (Hint) domain-containing protein n=1 Tax=Roseovarius bejariae TaxID=2576383 RepID=A0A844CHT3_9RHOB|nr:Hint domain-containing protein [Roseovarius bejariae]MRU14242.1 hypothetical protein [Roseovarius bejariae]